MNNKIIKQIERRFTLLLLCTLVSFAILLAIIMVLIYQQANHYFQIGILEQHYFYQFYYNYSFIINSFIFSLASVIVLVFFIFSFVDAIAYLQAILDGENYKRPWLFKVISSFADLEKQVNNYLNLIDEHKQAHLEASDYQNEMLMYLAHDLRTPLTSLIGYMSNIIDHHLESESQVKALDISIEKGNRLNHLINDFAQILTYDELNAIVYTKFDMGRLLQSQVHGFDPILEQKGFELVLDVQEYLLIEADYEQMLRLIDNLMRNAINYALHNSTIEVIAKQVDDIIYLSFANDSEILNEEQLNHMFDKFYRGEVARSSVSGGAGLGLAICKAIVDAHQGQIKVKQEGKRIIFEIELKVNSHG